MRCKTGFSGAGLGLRAPSCAAYCAVVRRSAACSMHLLLRARPECSAIVRRHSAAPECVKPHKMTRVLRHTGQSHPAQA
jgi:hypothetical protein